MLYDISINAKKTKWMLLGQPRSVVEETVKVNGVTLEKLNTFKFLGVIIDSKGCFKEHLAKRKSLFLTGLGEVQRLGFNKRQIPVKLKKVLYTAVVRSKLIYGFETIRMSESMLKKTLGSLEGNCLKLACGLNNRSKTTILSYGMGITPIPLYIYKRKINFILELLKNQATNELVSSGTHETLGDVISSLGIPERDAPISQGSYRSNLGKACLAKSLEIKNIEEKIQESPLILSVEYLLCHRNVANDDTLQYLLDPRRASRG
jgi:hypothetical protein